MTTVSTPVLDRAGLPPTARLHCRHCGEPCVEQTDTADGAFCCAGCASVYALLRAHALTDYYACAPDAGRPQRDLGRRAADRFAPLDDPAVAARFIESNDATWTHAVLHVPAMHCASCLWLLEQLWRFDPGVGRSEADLLRRTVRVAFRPDQTSLRAIAERLAALGYEPIVDAEQRSPQVPPARRTLYLKLGVAGFAFGNMMLFSVPRYANGAPVEGFQALFDALNLLLAVPVLLFSASGFFTAAWRALRLRAITLDVPIALGLTVLFGRSLFDIATRRGEGYLDSFAGLVFFLLIGRLFQQAAFDRIAFDRTVRSFLPLSVRVVDAGGLATRPLEAVCVGDVLFVRPGEVVPADALLRDASAEVDYAFVTGEADPEHVASGGAVAAGGRIAGHAVHLEVVRPVAHSRLAALWRAGTDAPRPPHWLSTIADRFGHWFTVAAIGLAVAGALAWWPDAAMAAQVATAVLIIACPCALTLAAPITLGTALGVLGRAGVYLKSGAVALDLSRVDAIAFDKTGTLTSGRSLSVVRRGGLDDADWMRVRRLAAESMHPVSRAIVGRDPVHGEVADVVTVPGRGVRGSVDGRPVAIGSARFVEEQAGVAIDGVEGRTYVAVDGRPGVLRLAAPERPGMTEVALTLSRSYATCLVSGDADGDAAAWRPAFGERMAFRQSPEGKREAVRALQREGRRVLMVGDGLNDVGALAAADVGMAVSDDAASLVPACDVVVRGDRLTQLPAILAYARRARQVIVLCFVVSLLYNVVGLSLALTGQLSPLASAVLMPISSLTIVALSVGLMQGAAPRAAA